jgi:hypothetical protein
MPESLQAKIPFTCPGKDDYQTHNLPSYKDLPECGLPEDKQGLDNERIFQIALLYPKISELSQFIELRYWEYPVKAVNSILYELLMNGQLNQEGLQKKLRRIQFNEDAELVTLLEAWVSILSAQKFIENQLGPVFNYLIDYKAFLENEHLSFNEKQIRNPYMWRIKEKIELLLNYSTAASNCVWDDSRCPYGDRYSLAYFTPLEINFSYKSSSVPQTIIQDVLNHKNILSEVAPEMSPIMSKFDKIWSQRVSIQKNTVENYWYYNWTKDRSCLYRVRDKFNDYWDSKILDEHKVLWNSRITILGPDDISPWHIWGDYFLSQPESKGSADYDLRVLNHWVVGSNKITAQLEQALLDFRGILSHLGVIENDQQGFSNSLRILTQDVVNYIYSPNELIAHLEVDSLTLPSSSIHAKNAILNILRGTEKIRYLYAEAFLPFFDESGIQQFFIKLRNVNESDYEWVISRNRYLFRILIEQLQFDKVRIKKYKQEFLESANFYNFTNRTVNLELSKIRFYKSLQSEMSQCPDSRD